MSNQELVRVDEVLDIELRRDPEVVLEAASKAAKALQRVVESKPRKVMIAGRQHLQYEDWQTLGQFYSYTVRTMEPKFVEVDGVKGAYARAEVIDFRTGLVVGGAEAYCMSDEENWAGKPWFQLASMAQTRAGAKALRNRLAWVAVLAGYEATPAEEMTGNEYAHPDKKPEHFCDKHSVAFRRFEKDGRVWYSHKDGDSWCNEAKAREVEPKQPKGNGKRDVVREMQEQGIKPDSIAAEHYMQSEGYVYAAQQVKPEPAKAGPGVENSPYQKPNDPPTPALWKRWQDLWNEAQQLGIEFEGVTPDISKADLIAKGQALKAKIDAWHDKPRTRVDHEPIDQRPDTVEDGADVPGMDELETDTAQAGMGL